MKQNVTKMNKTILRILLAAAVVLLFCGAAVGAAGAANVAKIGDTEYATVQAAVDAAANGQTITMINDSMENVVVSGKTVTLNLAGHMLHGGWRGSVISVVRGGNLTLEDKDRSTNLNGRITGGTGSESYGYGGGVYVFQSSFTMNGGLIYENTANKGGGVHVSDSMFTMNGGLIYRNTANSFGGGVYITGNDGRFWMNGGFIYGNTANLGGGVYGFLRSGFQMRGGAIFLNTAHGDGGGLYFEYGCGVITYNGDIVHNTAGRNGGGVYAETELGVWIQWGTDVSKNTPDNIHYGNKDEGRELESAVFDENGKAELKNSSIITSVTVTQSGSADTLMYNRNNGVGKPPEIIDGKYIDIIGDAFILALYKQEGPNPVAGISASLSGKLPSITSSDLQITSSDLQNRLKLAQKTGANGWTLLEVGNGKIEDSWYTFTAAFTSNEYNTYAFVLAEDPETIEIHDSTATFPDDKGKISCASGTGFTSPVSGMKLTSISEVTGVTGETLTFADRTCSPAYRGGLNRDARDLTFIGAFDVNADSTETSTMTFEISVNPGWKPKNIKFIHGSRGTDGTITWDSKDLASDNPVLIEDGKYQYTVTTSDFGPFAIVYAEKPASIPIQNDTAIFSDDEGKIGSADLRFSPQVSEVNLTTISGVKGTALTFADRTYNYAYWGGLNRDGWDLTFIGAFDVTAESTGTSTMTFVISVNSGWEPENIRFIHGSKGTDGTITWDSRYLESSYDPVKMEYTVTTDRFSPFAIVYAVPTPAPKKSSSTPQGTSIWLTAEPTPTETPTPTPTPTPEVPQVKPVEQKPAAQTGASPAPFMGVIAGLGCAAVVFGLRRK